MVPLKKGRKEERTSKDSRRVREIEGPPWMSRGHRLSWGEVGGVVEVGLGLGRGGPGAGARFGNPYLLKQERI